MDIEGVMKLCTTAHTDMITVVTTKGPPVRLDSIATATTEMLTSEGPAELLVHGVAVLGPAPPAGPVVVAHASAGPGGTRVTLRISRGVVWVEVAVRGGPMGDRSSTPLPRTRLWRPAATPAAPIGAYYVMKERVATLLTDLLAAMCKGTAECWLPIPATLVNVQLPRHTPVHGAPANSEGKGWGGLAYSVHSLAAIAGCTAAARTIARRSDSTIAVSTSAALPCPHWTTRELRVPLPLRALELTPVATPKLLPSLPTPLECRRSNGDEFAASSLLGSLPMWGGLLGP